MNGVQLIAQERERQVQEEGYTEQHDDQEHSAGDLAAAATCYVNFARLQAEGHPAASLPVVVRGQGCWTPPEIWPWSWDHWKPKADPLRNLVRAGALIAAEIDRIQREES